MGRGCSSLWEYWCEDCEVRFLLCIAPMYTPGCPVCGENVAEGSKYDAEGVIKFNESIGKIAEEHDIASIEDIGEK